MKTQILRLDPHDDVISACDKMSWGKAGRILLVWPEEGRILTRRLDLVRLARHSHSLGASLIVVSKDPRVRQQGRSLQIPVFRSLKQAQRAHWRLERRQSRREPVYKSRIDRQRLPPDLEDLRAAAHPPSPPWMTHPIFRLITFSLGVLALFAIAALLLPSAEVRLTPLETSQTIIFTVRADPRLSHITISGGVPAVRQTVTVEGRGEVDASGSVNIPGNFANGRVMFTNLTAEAITIPRGTVVRPAESGGARFTTTLEGTVISGPGTTVTLPVRALAAGSRGNLPPNSLIAIEGPLGLRLSATNPYPTRGGTERSVPVATPSDRVRLYNQLESALRQTALEELRTALSPGDLIFTGTLTLTQVLAETYFPALGEPTDRLRLNLRLEYQALTTSAAALNELATAALDANPTEGYQVIPGTQSIAHLGKPSQGDDGSLRWRMRATRKLRAHFSPSQAINLAVGQTLPLASARLERSLPLEARPQINLWPKWWPRMPALPFRISVQVD